MLAINNMTNTVVMLHCITKVHPPIGYHQGMHPAAGTTIALMGKAPYPGALPTVVTIPATAFNDKQMWPAATDMMINAATPTDKTIQPDGIHTMQMAKIIPLPHT